MTRFQYIIVINIYIKNDIRRETNKQNKTKLKKLKDIRDARGMCVLSKWKFFFFCLFVLYPTRPNVCVPFKYEKYPNNQKIITLHKLYPIINKNEWIKNNFNLHFFFHISFGRRHCIPSGSIIKRPLVLD